jgi:Fic family protein
VTISDIVRLTGTSRNTLKQHFRQLVAQGHLALYGSGRGAWYALP